MQTACPYCGFPLEVAPGYGSAQCPACQNTFSEVDATADPFAGIPQLDPEEAKDWGQPVAEPPDAANASFEPAAEPVSAEPPPWIGGEGGGEAVADPAGDAPAPIDMSLPPEEPMPSDFLAAPSDFLGAPDATATSGEAAEADGFFAVDSSSPAQAANADVGAGAGGWDAGEAVEGGADFLAAASEFITGPGDPNAPVDPTDLTLDVPPPADTDAGYDPNAAYDASATYDPDAGAAVSADAPDAVADPAVEEDPYAGLPVSWETASPALPTRPRLLPVVNEDGSLHEETPIAPLLSEAAPEAAAAPAAPPAIDDEAWFAASAAPAPPVPAARKPAPAVPSPQDLAAPPPPPAAAAAGVKAPPPAPPPEIPRFTPDAPGAPAPDFGPKRVTSDFRAPQRPVVARERTKDGAATVPVQPPDKAPSPVRRAPAVAVTAEQVSGTRSRMPRFFAAGAGGVLVAGLAVFAGFRLFSPAPASPLPLPVPTPMELAATSDADAGTSPEDVGPEPVVENDAASEPDPEPARTRRARDARKKKSAKSGSKAKPAPDRTPKAALPKATRTPAARPVGTPAPAATKLAMTAATPTPVPVNRPSSFLDAAPKARPASGAKTAGARFGANPNVDLSDPRYKALEAGHKLLAEWKNAAAVKQYRKVVRSYEGFADGHYWYGYGSQLQGDQDTACKELRRYLALAPAGYYSKKAAQKIRNCK